MIIIIIIYVGLFVRKIQANERDSQAEGKKIQNSERVNKNNSKYTKKCSYLRLIPYIKAYVYDSYMSITA